MNIEIGTFDGATDQIVAAWNSAAPADPITARRFRDLVLLDVNFDAEGLRVARVDGEVVGAAYGVRRRHASHAADLEVGSGWIPFFFVAPSARGRGVGRRLLEEVLRWLEELGTERVYFSSYTPNYLLPGLDARAIPPAAALLASLGFTTQYEAVAMDRLLVDYSIPEAVRDSFAALRKDGYVLGSATADDLPELVELAGSEFNHDWARGIREAVVGGLPVENIVIARDPAGVLQGGRCTARTRESYERFGPFGVHPATRGPGSEGPVSICASST